MHNSATNSQHTRLVNQADTNTAMSFRVAMGTYMGSVTGLTVDTALVLSPFTAGDDDSDDEKDDATILREAMEQGALGGNAFSSDEDDDDGDGESDDNEGDVGDDDVEGGGADDGHGGSGDGGEDYAHLQRRLPSAFAVDAHIGSVRCVASSHGGKWLASGGSDENIRVYDMRKTKMFGVLHKHTSSVTSLEFFGDSHLISAAEDGSLLVWAAANWQCVFELTVRLL
jgi:hypothetical protein